MSVAIEIPALLDHQIEPGESPARFKANRWGRRTGKTTFSENISVIGHGPLDANGVPLFRALIHGLDIVWIAPTIPQANIMWHTDVAPRFKNKHPLVKVNENDKTVVFSNPDGTPFATLWVRSSEAASSIRGIGAKLGGVVIDEAAHMDLEYVWRSIIRPALMDCGGWAVINSTTNAGPDGHRDEEGTRTPSFFNILCEEIQSQKRGPEWAEFYRTAQDNPKIAPHEFAALVAEYPEDSPELAQEVFAKLIIGGSGVAFPEWADDAHVARYEPPRDQGAWSGFGDWGHLKPGGLWLAWSGSERSLVRWEYYFRDMTPYNVGYSFGQQILRFPKPDWIAVDVPAVSDGGPTIIEELQRGMNDAVGRFTTPPVFITPPKGPGSRETAKLLVHQSLKYTRLPDGSIPVWGFPAVQFHADCVNLCRTFPRLPRDPKGKPDVDTNAEDHPYDGYKGWLMSRIPHIERKKVKADQDTHPGFTKEGERNDTPGWYDELLRSGAQLGSRWSRTPEDT